MMWVPPGIFVLPRWKEGRKEGRGPRKIFYKIIDFLGRLNFL
jgi:hypothetical protein